MNVEKEIIEYYRILSCMKKKKTTMRLSKEQLIIKANINKINKTLSRNNCKENNKIHWLLRRNINQKCCS